MLIKNKIVQIFDIEVFPNCFHCCVMNDETEEIIETENDEPDEEE